MMSPVASYFLLTAFVIASLGLAAFGVGLVIGRKLWRSHRNRATDLRTEITRLRASIGAPPSPQE